MSTFNIWGPVKFDVELEVEAKDEQEARHKAIAMLNDMYHLDCTGSVYHDRKLVEYDFFVDNIDDENPNGANEEKK